MIQPIPQNLMSHIEIQPYSSNFANGRLLMSKVPFQHPNSHNLNLGANRRPVHWIPEDVEPVDSVRVGRWITISQKMRTKIWKKPPRGKKKNNNSKSICPDGIFLRIC